jgi:uncharacterized small protein (DUF1192 family)
MKTKQKTFLEVVKMKQRIVPIITLNAYIDFLEDTDKTFDTTVLKNIRKSLEQDLVYVSKLQQKISKLQNEIRKLKNDRKL